MAQCEPTEGGLLLRQKISRRRLFKLFGAVIFFAQFTKGYAMEANAALQLVQAWGKNSKDMTFIGAMEVDARGGFVTRASGAFFRYEPQTKRLVVSGLIGYNDTMHAEFPDTWQKLVRAGKREHAAVGEGEFELYRKKLFQFDPDIILLSKSYTGDLVDPRQFEIETRWLLSAATYWRMKRYSEVTVEPEEQLIHEAPGINARWPKRPW